MPLATLTAAPVPPAGRSITAASRLVIVLTAPYSDTLDVYAVRHEAAWDATHDRWKPVDAPDGTPFQVPAGGDGWPAPPPATLHETLVLDDGTRVLTRRGPLRLTLTTWPVTEGA